MKCKFSMSFIKRNIGFVDRCTLSSDCSLYCCGTENDKKNCPHWGGKK